MNIKTALLVTLVLVLVSCSAGAVDAPTSTAVPTATPTDRPTHTPIPTSTNTPSATPPPKAINTPAQTPEPRRTLMPTATPSFTPIPKLTGQATSGVNLRSGPGVNYAKVGGLASGDSVEVVGCTSDHEWYQVRAPSGTLAWVAATYISLTSQSGAVPTVQPGQIPPTPTPAPATNTPVPTNTAVAADTPTTTSVPVATSTPVPPPPSEGPTEVTAWVSNDHPGQNSNVTVFGKLVIGGKPIQGAVMQTAWHYKSTTSTCEGVTGGDGVAACERKIGRATKGYTVNIRVTFTHEGKTYQVSTAFTPQ